MNLLVSGSVFEAPTFVAGVDDPAGMREPVEQRDRHLGVAKDARPFGESEIDSDNGGGLINATLQLRHLPRTLTALNKCT